MRFIYTLIGRWIYHNATTTQQYPCTISWNITGMTIKEV